MITSIYTRIEEGEETALCKKDGDHFQVSQDVAISKGQEAASSEQLEDMGTSQFGELGKLK